MRKVLILIISGLILLSALFGFFNFKFPSIKNIEVERVTNGGLLIESEEEQKAPKQELDYFPPIDNFEERISKKSFGDYITPQTSPVQPEKFQGYHTGVDLEIFPGEEQKEVKVFAFCEGGVIEKRKVSGYGGVLVQACQIEGNPVTVLYGHLKLDSIQKSEGEKLKKGELIGILGKGFSFETDGERKHLHFAIHKGEAIDSRGYVQQKEELKEWLNPLTLLGD